MGKNEIAIKMKEARENAGLTQAQVGKFLGVSYQAISNYERGISRIDSDTLMRLCDLYHISVSSVLGEIYTCPECGLGYCPTLASERKIHDDIHKEYIKEKSHFGFMWDTQKSNEIKAKSWAILYDASSTQEKKEEAVINIFKSYFCRSVHNSGLGTRHIPFKEYVPMLLNQQRWKDELPNEIYNSLVKQYGVRPGLKNRETTIKADLEIVFKKPDITAQEQQHLKKYRRLNDDGKDRLDSYMDDLLTIDKYKAPSHKSILLAGAARTNDGDYSKGEPMSEEEQRAALKRLQEAPNIADNDEL